jgi:hypothetical protein
MVLKQVLKVSYKGINEIKTYENVIHGSDKEKKPATGVVDSLW